MNNNPSDIVCAQCSKLLARFEIVSQTHMPSAEALFAAGAVPVPNFGWFCNQECATKYERAQGRKIFGRNEAGQVQYYPFESK